MNPKTRWESFKVESANVVEKVKQAVQEGNVRRIVVKHKGRTVAECPLTAGVVGTVLATVLSAIAAVIALLKHCTIEVERFGEPVSVKASQPIVNESVDDLC